MLNLGAPAFEAAARLKHTDDWKIIVAAMAERMAALMHTAIEMATPEACGYARGMRDVMWAFEMMEAGPDAPTRATIKPRVPVMQPEGRR